MTNNRKVRLIQVAKEFKVGLNSITDYLLKKGVADDLTPNSPVSPEVYAMLEKEFGSNRSITGKERDNVREKISLGKKESITIDNGKKEEDEAQKDEVIIKSNIISVKDEVPQPKILGKIDLNAPAKPKVEPQPKKEEVKKVEEPKKEEPKPALAPQPKKEEKPAEAPVEHKDSTFRPETATLTGPKVLGTMDVTGMIPGGKHKRKRLQKEKVDVTKAQKGQQGGGKNEQRGGGQQNQNRPGQQNQQQNQYSQQDPPKHQAPPSVCAGSVTGSPKLTFSMGGSSSKVDKPKVRRKSDVVLY